MLTRSILTVAALAAAVPAVAAELRPEEAKHFIAGKHFSYTCFEGTTGAGRINADGSVVGTIQIRGSGPVHFVTLPVGTIQVQSTSICASLRGIPFQPCFAVNQTDSRSFRGSLAGFSFAYCDFTRHSGRVEAAATPNEAAHSHEVSHAHETAHPRETQSDDTMRTSISE
jgi:hypothetical protein